MPTTRHEHIATLAAHVELHHTTELDLRDAAVDVDNGAAEGDPHLILALTASVLDQSASDTLQELFEYLGWECGHGHSLARGCHSCD
jgi:hypothetical protein